MATGSLEREQVTVAEWLSATVGVVQLILNGAALIGGAIIWQLYVANLKAAAEVKDATIETVEKSRDFWKEKAEELEKRSPEVVEKALAERIQIREGEIDRLKADKEFDKIAVRTLETSKAELEQDLFRTQGFRAMLSMEDEVEDANEELLPEMDSGFYLEQAPSKIEVVRIGEVAVDSGQLMVTDPCYIDSEWRREPYTGIDNGGSTQDANNNYSYDGACHATLDKEGHGQLAFRRGHSGAGVAFSTAWGDGSYPVYAEKHDGRIVRVYVNVG